jgi:16S rRNA (cytidine1402-2'-O)-methyltransferase
MQEASLFIVPTPIGNLEDITFRAVRVLKEVDVILVEDTRNSGFLLKHYNISTKMFAFHQFNEHKVLNGLIERIKNGERMAIITDAGTPGISDPGFLLIRECIKNDIQIECLPGATAFVPALINSGLPSDKFFFEGFLPHKKGRQSRLKELAELPYTIVFYESPHRLVKTLEQFSISFGAERLASVSRELTKIHEENARGTLQELLKHFSSKQIKGEIVIVVGPKN